MTPRLLHAARTSAAVLFTACALAVGGGRMAAADTVPPPGSTTTTSTTSPPASTTTSSTSSTSSTSAPPVTPLPTVPPAATPPPTTVPVADPPATSGAIVPTPAPPTTIGATTTSGPTTTTAPLVDPAKLAALVQGLDGDLARAAAIAAYQAARTAAAQLAAGQAADPTVDRVLVEAATTQLQATATRAAAQDQFDQARRRINQVGVALYVGVQVPSDAGPLSGSVATRSMLLSVILDEERTQLRAAHQALDRAKDAYEQSRRRADDLVNARAAALEAKARVMAQAMATSSTSAAPSTLAPSSTTTIAGSARRPVTTLPPELVALSPTILGPSALSADEILGWYAASGHQPQLTVPLRDLVREYQTRGAADGVRADMAFAQAVLETGYLGFPSYGQVAAADNNFAGIGACDSCATGTHFPDAATGVAAHLQLLHTYATTAPLDGPLPGPSWVTGCCPTWLGLTGVWATAPNYGFSILRTYRSMVAWALSHRSATAGL